MKEIVAFVSLLMFVVCSILGLLEGELSLLAISAMYAIAFQLWREDSSWKDWDE